MRRMHWLLTGVTVALWLVGGSVGAQSPQSSPPKPAPASSPAPAGAEPGNAQDGRRLYTEYFCFACHGFEGQGGRDGVRIATTPQSLDVFRAYVRKPAGVMPAYTSKVLSDQDLVDIRAYLRSLPKPPALSSIPLLNQ
jgi:mono/diheme cytochrome c family protein